MISKNEDAEYNRKQAIDLVIDVLKAQPELITCIHDGNKVTGIIADMADGIIKYITTGTIPSYDKTGGQ